MFGRWVRRHRAAPEAYVDTHHVISPALRSTLLRAHVPQSRVVLRPLFDIDPEQATTSRRRARRPMTIGFVGRLTQQKRPFLFLALARWLQLLAPGRFRFVLHGDGELEDLTAGQLRRGGLAARVERRSARRAVSDTYADSDVIVLPSDNEGLALVTFEAVRAGCLVVCTDVGSQRSVVTGAALLPRHPYPFLIAAVRLLLALCRDPARVAALRAEQQRRVDGLAGLEGAAAWVRGLYADVAAAPAI